MRLGTAGMKSAGRPRIQTPQAGQVVLSLAGRDAGRLMVVLERSVEEGFVLTADGRRRKLANPKRKRARHLRTVGAALKPEQYATDRRLPQSLSSLYQPEQHRREPAEDKELFKNDF